MKEGRVVERGATEAVFADPKNPYTQALMAAAFPAAAAVPEFDVGAQMISSAQSP